MDLGPVIRIIESVPPDAGEAEREAADRLLHGKKREDARMGSVTVVPPCQLI